jgi:hypothetical protein
VISASLKRRFNHDLLIDRQDQQFAEERWPAIHRLLCDSALSAAFNIHERAAKTYKAIVQWLGSFAVLLTWPRCSVPQLSFGGNLNLRPWGTAYNAP